MKIDLSRGRPSKEQLDLSNNLLNAIELNEDFFHEGDLRNYGILDGINSAKEFFSKISNIDKNDFIVCGNSSLNLEYELVSDGFIKGVCENTPWNQLKKIKWICLVPGYDRHFSISEYFNMEMISVPLTDEGPDMNLIEKIVQDPQVKGIWCVPMYSNPLGISFSDDVIKRFAALKPAANDFRVYWDMAYCLHHLNENCREILNVFDEAKKIGNEDLFYLFYSTSKMTFAGSGIAAVACSDKNKIDILNHLKYKTICSDKINQYRHSLFFKDSKFYLEHMKMHRNLIKPKFDALLSGLRNLKPFCKVIEPQGGYFISIFVRQGTAKKVIKRCAECGLILTNAGCGYPHHFDEQDSHIRIAPTCLDLSDINDALAILSTSIKIEYLSNEN